MKLLKKLLVGAGVVAVLLVVIGFVLPDRVHVERSSSIQAPPGTVFAVLNSFKRFNEWSPWYGLDPKAITTYEGPAAGVGAKMSWKSEDPGVGAGSQEIIASDAPRQIRVRLVFADWESENTSTYTLEPQALDPETAGTRLTWGYDSEFKGKLLARYFGLIMDGMLGPDYEKGLASLKTLVEGLPKADFSGADISVVDVQAQPLAYVSGTTSTDPAAIGTALAVAYSKIAGFIHAQGLKPAAPPLVVARKWDETAKLYEYDAGIPVAGSNPPPSAEGDVRLGQTYSGKAVRLVHRGSYTGLPAAYEKLFAYLAVAGLERGGSTWEQYMSDPGTAEAELITHLYSPIR